MNVYSILRATIAGLAVAVLQLATANAGTISTPILLLSNDTDQVLCIATNVSGAPITVKVTILGVISGAPTQTCTLPVNERAGCSVVFFGAGQCRILITGLTHDQVLERVRGVMFTRAISAPFAIEAVVQAQ
jgi:hypothetical protein